MTELSVAVRSLRTNLGFTATVTLSLALAIGAIASAFSVVDAVRFRALPFADADRLVLLSEVPTGSHRRQDGANACASGCSVAFTTYQNVIARTKFRSVDAIAAFTAGIKSLTVNGEGEPVLGTLATDSLFSMLRAAPALGRAFTADDHKLGATPVVILSHELWSTRLGGDRSILGTPVQLSDTKYIVVGVMPPGFDFESGSRFWLPAVPSLDPSTRPSIRTVAVVARLARGMSIEQARAEFAGVAIPEQRGPSGTTPLTLATLPLRARYTSAAQNHDVIFFAVVLAVVLIACANLTNLLLARGLDQRREFAVRAALGAEPSRLARHVLVQNSLLAVAGAALGLVMADTFLGIVRSLTVLNTFRPTGLECRVDWRVAAFAFVVSAIAVAVMSVVPVRLVLAARAQDALRESSSSTRGGVQGAQVQRIFVAAQVACAVTLLIAAGLTVRVVMRIARVDPGFSADKLVQTTPSFPHDWRVKEKYVPATARAELMLRSIPGVRSTAISALNPLGSSRAPAEISLSGASGPLPRGVTPSSAIAVDSGYFSTLGIPIVKGRAFTANDLETTMPVAIVNEWAAKRWWPSGEPIGAQVRIDTLPGQGVTVTIVGVARDNKAARGNLLLATDGPELYRPILQAPSAFPGFYSRIDGGTAAVLRPIRVQFGEFVLGRPVSTRVMSEQIEQQMEGVRTTARQVAAFGVIGLLLALVGVYGVLSYSVNRRTRELGIRRALGASAPSVYGMIVRDALIVIVPGTALGVLGAFYTGQFVAPLLYGTPARDTATFVVIAAVVIVAAVASAIVPAARAARVSPLTAIRNQ